MDYFKVLDNGQVMKVSEVGENVIESHYDMFLHVELTASKTQILPNGVDFATITAAVYDYEGNLVPHTGDVFYDVEGERFTLQAGESIEIASDFANVIDVSAWIENSRAGGCVIDAKES